MNLALEPHPCFFYGSLMDPRVLDYVTSPGRDADLFTVRASIEGYIRHPYRNEAYPGMIASQEKSHSVEGILVFGHTAMDRFRLDQFEGSEYTRELLLVKVLDPVPGTYNIIGQSTSLTAGDTVSAYVYIFTGPHAHLDQTNEWDFAAFQNEHVTAWMKNSPDFRKEY